MKEWHLAQLVGDAARLNAEAAAWQRAAAANAVRVLVAGGDEDVVDDDDEEDEVAIQARIQSRDPLSALGACSPGASRRARLASALRFPLPTNVAASATTRDWTPFASFARAAESALIRLVTRRVEGLRVASSSDPADDFAPTDRAPSEEPSEAMASTLTYLDGTLRLASATLPTENARRLAEASVGAAARGLVDAARSPAVRKVTERGVARMRADLDALETFAASLSTRKDPDRRRDRKDTNRRRDRGRGSRSRRRGCWWVCSPGRRGGGGGGAGGGRSGGRHVGGGARGDFGEVQGDGGGGDGLPAEKTRGGGGARAQGGGGERGDHLAHARKMERVLARVARRSFWFRLALRASSVIGAIVYSSILVRPPGFQRMTTGFVPVARGHTHILAAGSSPTRLAADTSARA